MSGVSMANKCWLAVVPLLIFSITAKSDEREKDPLALTECPSSVRERDADFSALESEIAARMSRLGIQRPSIRFVTRCTPGDQQDYVVSVLKMVLKASEKAPSMPVREGEARSAMVSIKIARDGTLIEVVPIDRKEENPAVVGYVMEIVESAAPFPSFPQAMLSNYDQLVIVQDFSLVEEE